MCGLRCVPDAEKEKGGRCFCSRDIVTFLLKANAGLYSDLQRGFRKLMKQCDPDSKLRKKLKKAADSKSGSGCYKLHTHADAAGAAAASVSPVPAEPKTLQELAELCYEGETLSRYVPPPSNFRVCYCHYRS